MFKLPSYHSTYRVRQKSFFLRGEKKQKKKFYTPLMMRNGKMNIVFSTTRQKSVPRNTFQRVRFVQTKTSQQITRMKRKYYAKQLLPVVSRKFLFKRTLLRRKKFLTFLPKLVVQKKRRRCRKKRKPKRKKIATLERGKRGIVYKKAFRSVFRNAFWGHRLLLTPYREKVHSLAARINFRRNLPWKALRPRPKKKVSISLKAVQKKKWFYRNRPRSINKPGLIKHWPTRCTLRTRHKRYSFKGPYLNRSPKGRAKWNQLNNWKPLPPKKRGRRKRRRWPGIRYAKKWRPFSRASHFRFSYILRTRRSRVLQYRAVYKKAIATGLINRNTSPKMYLWKTRSYTVQPVRSLSPVLQISPKIPNPAFRFNSRPQKYPWTHLGSGVNFFDSRKQGSDKSRPFGLEQRFFSISLYLTRRRKAAAFKKARHRDFKIKEKALFRRWQRPRISVKKRRYRFKRWKWRFPRWKRYPRIWRTNDPCRWQRTDLFPYRLYRQPHQPYRYRKPWEQKKHIGLRLIRQKSKWGHLLRRTELVILQNRYFQVYSDFYGPWTRTQLRKKALHFRRTAAFRYPTLNMALFHFDHRIDVALCRLHLAPTLKVARLLVRQGYVRINEEQVINPQTLVHPWDLVQITRESDYWFGKYWYSRNTYHRYLYRRRLEKFKHVYSQKLVLPYGFFTRLSRVTDIPRRDRLSLREFGRLLLI